MDCSGWWEKVFLQFNVLLGVSECMLVYNIDKYLITNHCSVSSKNNFAMDKTGEKRDHLLLT